MRQGHVSRLFKGPDSVVRCEEPSEDIPDLAQVDLLAIYFFGGGASTAITISLPGPVLRME